MRIYLKTALCYLFLFNNGKSRKDIAPKNTTIRVCDIHIIQPNAFPETAVIPKIFRDLLTAIG